MLKCVCFIVELSVSNAASTASFSKNLKFGQMLDKIRNIYFIYDDQYFYSLA